MTDLPHEQGCACCGEVTDEMFLHSRCHPASPMWAAMNRSSVLILRCAECDAVVSSFGLRSPQPSSGGANHGG